MMLDEPRCSERRCAHYQGIRSFSKTHHVPYCVAFPEGIPNEIAYGDNLHTVHYEGDRGILYEREAGT